MSGPLKLDLTSHHQPLRGCWELNPQVLLIAEPSLQAQQNRLYSITLQKRMPPQKEGKDDWRANLAQNSVLFGEIIYGKKFLLSFSVDWYSRKILFEHSTLSKFSTRLVRQTAWYFPHLSAPRPASASLQLGEGDIVPPAHCDSDDLQEHLILKTNRITDLPHDPVHFIRVIYSLGKSLLKGVLGSLPVTMPLKKMSLHVSPTIINCI